MSQALVADELYARALVQPFGPQMPAEPFHLVHPEQQAEDCWPTTLRDWILSLHR